METVLIAVLTIIASSVGTVSGFGLSTIMVPLLSIFIPLSQTLLLVGIIHWFGDIWKLTLFRQGISQKLILFFGIPGIITAFLGARIVFSVSEIFLSRLLGAFLITYVAFLFFNPSFKFPQSPTTAMTGGALSGFFAGVFGIGGAVRSAFLAIFDLKKAVYIATGGAIGAIIDSARIAAYFTGGIRLNHLLIAGLLIFIPASFLGAEIGKKIVDKIPQERFRKIVVLFLFLLGLKLVLFPG